MCFETVIASQRSAQSAAPLARNDVQTELRSPAACARVVHESLALQRAWGTPGEGGIYHNGSADLTDREADTSSSGWNQGFGAKRLNEILPPVRT